MKRIDLVISLVLVPVDYVMLVAAGVTSYSTRYQPFVTQIRPVFFDYPFKDFIPLLLAVAVIGVIIFALGGLYRVTSYQKLTELFSKVFLGVSTMILLIIVSIFLQRELFSSRFIIILAWVSAIVYVFIARVLVYRFRAYFMRRGVGRHRLAIIGTSKVVNDITAFFRDERHYEYDVIRTYDAFDEKSFVELTELSKEKALDEILYAGSEGDRAGNIVALADFCHERNLAYRYIAHAQQVMNYEIESIAGYPVIHLKKTPLEGWGSVMKRLFDITVSLIGIIVASPLALCIACLIKMDSRGPILVKLTRVGRGGAPFQLYKFRSMVDNAHDMKEAMSDLNERDGPLFKIKNDPRVTRIGKLLRKTSVDELPQLFNVLMGEMSLVGPRPHEPEEVARYELPYRTLVGAKPGITGLSQVSGRSNLLFREEADLDMYYIEHWSLTLDLQILFKTIVVIFRFKDAA